MRSKAVFQFDVTDGQVTAWATELKESARDLRDSFNHAHHARLSGLLSESTLEILDHHIGREEFQFRAYEEIGAELCVDRGPAQSLLMLLAHDPMLFRFVRAVTGCSYIGCFDGRISRLMPGQSFAWHSDSKPERLVGMSINLGQGRYQGGELQFRDPGGTITEVANPGRGDATLFAVRSGLQHRITRLDGDLPRTAFTGWFQPGPVFPLLVPGRHTRFLTR